MDEPRRWTTTAFDKRAPLTEEEHREVERYIHRAKVHKPYIGVFDSPDWWEMPEKRRLMLLAIMAAGAR